MDPQFNLTATRVAECLYGENPQQTNAALYTLGTSDPLALPRFTVVAGTPPSKNNWTEVNRELQTITHIAAGFDLNGGDVPPIVIGTKHGNCCGASVNADPLSGLKEMLDGDPRAIFGGLVMATFPIGQAEAEILLSYGMPAGERRILDGVIAPSFSAEAIAILKRYKDKCRFIENPALASLTKESLDFEMRAEVVRGAVLVQDNFTYIMDMKHPKLVVHGPRSVPTEKDMILAWAIGCTSWSNTITLVRNGMLIGNGVGQQDRVGGCQLAVHRAAMAGHSTVGAVAYSDSFFPFPDGPSELVLAGITAILTSSKESKRAQEVIDAFIENGVILYMIPDEVGRGFFH